MRGKHGTVPRTLIRELCHFNQQQLTTVVT
jgi:hypothetical protein